MVPPTCTARRFQTSLKKARSRGERRSHTFGVVLLEVVVVGPMPVEDEGLRDVPVIRCDRGLP